MRGRLRQVFAYVLLVLPACGCSHWSRITERDRQGIVERLTAQDAAWNAGDLEAFMEPYWQSEDLTFSSGGKVTRGWESTLKHYQSRYPTREIMGQLTFSDLEIRGLGRKSALVLGRWRLERENPIGGAFTLVMRRERGRWIIVHDHTSKDDP